jgi:hypothetical protein
MRRRLALLLVVLVALGGVAAVLFWPTHRQRALARVEELSGTYREDRDDDGRTLVIVGLIERPITDEDLRLLQHIRPLNRLLLDGTNVTDAGLVQLEGIEGLEWVSVCGTKVTDVGIANLSRIRTLKSIHFTKTQVSDAGIAHLQGMPNLVFVNAIRTRVTAAGVDELRRTTPRLENRPLRLRRRLMRCAQRNPRGGCTAGVRMKAIHPLDGKNNTGAVSRADPLE